MVAYHVAKTSICVSCHSRKHGILAALAGRLLFVTQLLSDFFWGQGHGVDTDIKV